MYNLKIKAPIDILDEQTYNLCDFVDEFSDFNSDERNSLFGCKNISKNLIKTVKNGKLYFKNKIPVCPHCNSKKHTQNGNKERILIFLNKGKQICVIKKYKCKKCGKTYYTDMSSIVNEFNNVTKPVVEKILHLYSIFGISIYKIQKELNEEHNVDISHQTIERILLGFNFNKKHNPWTLSGYYLFDSLWVKIKGRWKYLLALFDVKMNTIVSFDLVESEGSKTIYDFINKSTSNQPKKSITTDLKKEYREIISRLGFKHQFCHFHTKQMINRNINDYIKENNCNEDDIELIKNYKTCIFEILNCESFEEARRCEYVLFEHRNELPEVIFGLFMGFIVPYFKSLTYCLEDSNIERTSNKIENAFGIIFPKHIKKTMRTFEGVLTRFGLKLRFWDGKLIC